MELQIPVLRFREFVTLGTGWCMMSVDIDCDGCDWSVMAATMLNSANQFFPVEVYWTSQPFASMRMIRVAHIEDDRGEPVAKMDIYLCHLSIVMDGGNGSTVTVPGTGLSGFWTSSAVSFAASPTATFPAAPNSAMVRDMQQFIENGEDIFAVHARFADGDLIVNFPSTIFDGDPAYSMSVNQTFLAAKIL